LTGFLNRGAKVELTEGRPVRRQSNIDILLILTLIGALLGSIVGEALAKSLPVLAKGVSAGIDPPVTLDLFVIKLTLGFSLKLNVASAIGIVFALLLFRRT
jgi:hypothetical protein